MTEPLQAGVDHAELLDLAVAALKAIRSADIHHEGFDIDTDTDIPAGAVSRTWIGPLGLVAKTALREIDALRAAPVLPDRGWRPIESAPENTDLLVCVTHNLGEDEWETVQWVDFRQGERWCHYASMIHVPFPPTHWMPLPDAPAEGAE